MLGVSSLAWLILYITPSLLVLSFLLLAPYITCLSHSSSYDGVPLGTQLACLAHVSKKGKKAAQRVGVLGSLLNRRSSLSSLLLSKHLIHPMMDYACPICRRAACSHIWKLQVLQYRCLCTVSKAPLYIGNRQIHKDLGIPFFANHIRVLTESLDSMLANAGNPYFSTLEGTCASLGLTEFPYW
jgi:hypothetical protein